MFKSSTITLWSLLFLFCLHWQSTYAQNEPDLTINTTRSIHQVTAGETLDITFTVGNFGSADATEPYKIRVDLGGGINLLLGEFIVDEDIPLFHTIDITHTFEIPANFPAGTYDLLSIISNVDNERDDPNGNFALSRIIVRAGTGGNFLPDLTASNLVIRPESDISLRYDIDYSNIGNGIAEFSRGFIYISDDPSLSDDDAKVFPITVAGLNAGVTNQVVDGRFTFQDFTFSGEKYIIFSLNEGDNNGEGIRTESDVTNNTISVLYNFDGTPPNDDIDIALSDFSLDVIDEMARPGQEVTATYTVSALEGATPATKIVVELLGRFLSTETVILLEEDIPALEAGASTVLTSTFIIPTDARIAEYTLRSRLDPNGEIGETGSTNNNSAFNSLFITYPDLEITNVSCPVQFPSRTPGSQLTYEVTLRNNASVATLPTTIYLYQARTGRGRSTDDQLASADLPAIPSGQSITIPVVATFDAGVNFPPFRSNNGEVGYGNFYFSLTEFVLVFSTTEPFRLTDTFDIFCKKTNTDVGIELSADVLTYGVDRKVQYTVTVTNNGAEVANNIQTNIGFREAPRGMIIGTPTLSKGFTYEPGGGFPSKLGWFVESLAPGESATADVIYELFLQDNTDPTVEVYELSFLELPSIEDSNESNNTTSLTFTEGPSAGICKLDFEFNEFTNLNPVIPGSTVTFDLKFTNLSPNPLPASTFGLYAERTENGEVVGRKLSSSLADLPAFAPNESKDLMIELTFNDPFRFEPGSTVFNLGRYFLAANINDSDELCSFNYNFLGIDYPDANLILEEINSEGCFGTDNTVAADLKISNQGTTDITTPIVVFLGGTQVNPNTPGVVFSDSDTSDDFPGSAYWVIDGGLAVGESTTLPRPFLSPDGETVRASPYVSRDFSALDNLQSNLSLLYVFDADCSNTPLPCSGDITLSSQAEVDAFGPCEVYDGSITIDGNDISSLGNLSSLKRINGVLIIQNTNLIDLSGLDNLEAVQVLTITENLELTGLTALTNLTQSPEALTLTNNPQLASLAGLGNIAGTGVFNLVNNDLITTLAPISNVAVTGTIIITNNANLQRLEAFTGTQTLATLLLIENPKLASIQEFSNLVAVGESLQIILSGLSNLLGLENLQEVLENLTIANNGNLDNIDALSNLREVGDLVLAVNTSLSDCCGLFPVLDANGVTGTTTINDNASGCNSAQDIIDNCDDGTPTCTFSETGVLRDLTGQLAGCGFVIELPTDGRLEPLGFPAGFTPIDGQQVRFTSQVADDVASTCQSGTIVDIICIENIPVMGGDIDLELNLTASKPDIDVFEGAKFTLTISNTSTKTATDIEVDFSNPNIVLNNGEQPVASQGSFAFFGDQIWYVGDLGAGQSATLEVNYFFLKEPFLYAEVSQATGDDADSTPANGDGQTAKEDDEAVFPDDGALQLPDFELVGIEIGQFDANNDFNVVNDGDIINSDFELDLFAHVARARFPNGPTTVTFSRNVYLSTDNILDVNDVLLLNDPKTFEFDPSSDLVEGGWGAFSIPANTPDGDYFLIAKYDAEDEVAEANEDNNTLSLAVTLENGNEEPCSIELTLLDAVCISDTEFEITVKMVPTNLNDPPLQTYTIVDGIFLGTSFGSITQTQKFIVPFSSIEGDASSFIQVYDSSNSDCGTTLVIDPDLNCGTNTCQIESLVTNIQCDNASTPNDPSDDTFTFDLTINNPSSSGSSPVIVNTQCPINNGLYGQTVKNGPFLISNFNDTFSCVVRDSEDTNCSTDIIVNVPTPCSNDGGDDIDIELTLTAENPDVGIFEGSKFTLSITNAGGQHANNVEVDFSNPNIVLNNGEQPIASQGTFGFFGDQVWNVGDLGAGENATLTVNYFFLSKPFLYAEVSMADGNDADSTPGNGDGQNANEDDEVVFPSDVTPPTCDLKVVVNSVNCELPFVTYSITVTGTSTSEGIGLFVPIDENGNDVFQALEPNVPQTVKAYFGDGIAPIVRTYGVFAGDNPPTNCEATFDITCTATEDFPDLTLANLRVTENGIAGEVLPYFVDVQNIGTVDATGDYTIGAFLSSDDVLDANDPQVGVIPTGNTPVGTIADVPGAITVPDNTTTGDYFLILKTDRDNDISESNEGNNVIAIRIKIDPKSCDCPDIYDPVCGSDGTTYSNSCEAECAEIIDYTVGECDPCICPDVYDPVCGSDGMTYSNSCEAECAGITDYIPGECPTGDGIDLELNLGAANPNVGVYQNTLFTLTLRNTGDEAASNIKVSLPLKAGRAVLSGGTTPTVSQGSYNAFTDQIWDVGTLGAGQSATLELDIFFLAKPFLFAQVTAATGDDPDSTPNNGDGLVANEDDEAVFGGTIGNDCRIVVSIFSKRCNDNGTPDNPDDDTYTFTVKPTATNGSDKFTIISPINTEMPVDYGTELDLGPFAISDGALKVIIIDSDNASCQTEITVQPPATCSNGSGESDVVLTIDAPATYNQYTTIPVVYTVTNNSTTANARNIVISTPQPVGTTNSSATVSQGEFDLFREQWNVGTLAPGATATLTWNIFAVTDAGINGFGQIVGDDEKVSFSIGLANLSAPNINGLSQSTIENIQLYPTVTANQATVVFEAEQETTIEMAIYTLQGQRVMMNKQLINKGLNKHQIDLTSLASGTYFVKIGNYQTLRLVKI